MAFIETRFLDAFIAAGSAAGPEYVTDITSLYSGRETRNQTWSYPRHRYAIRIAAGSSSKIAALRSLHHSTKGRFNGFRFKDFNDWSSAADMETDADYYDQYIATGDGATLAFQLQKTYESGAESLVREITKPVSGTLKIGYTEASATPAWSVPQTRETWSLDTATGIVTLSGGYHYTVNGASSIGGGLTRVVVGYHSYVVNDVVYLKNFTGDWAGLNDIRFTVTNILFSSYIDIQHDSSSYAAYSANGGDTYTAPQSGEYITAGYEFDVPVRFNQDQILIEQISPDIEQANIELIEIK